jgi:hypothetical protein
MADRAQLYKYKGNRCTSCGLSVVEMVARHGTFNRMFELHHIDPVTKHHSYENLMRRTLSSEQIEEVDKCTLLCTQCHATIHAQEITAKLELSVEIGQRKVSQCFEGWVKADILDKTFTFVTNQRFLLQPCEVRVGKKNPVELCVIEIEKDGNLLDWLQNISQYKSVEILARSNREVLMQIEHAGERKVKITQAIGFPVTTIDLSTQEGGENNVWMRNGVVLTKKGEIFTSGTLSYNCDLL